MVRIIGSYISPYVRKVLVCLDLKGIPYEIDPIVPFFGNQEFGKISPVRRIPVLIDEDIVLPDSTVICEYLEDRYPDPPIYPARPAERARARWLEEYAGSRMGEVFIWRVFDELVIRRFVWGDETNQEVVQHSLEVDIPEILDYLEGVLPAEGFLFGSISVADVSIATFFRNLELCGIELALDAWPKTGGFIARVLDLPVFKKLRAFEDVSVRTPIQQHREALKAAGAPLSSDSYFSPRPRRGVLSTRRD